METWEKRTLIFPPLALSRKGLEWASFLFGWIGLCLPWYMHGPMEKDEDTNPPACHVLRPPGEFKPPEDFPRLLQEYRTWMKDHSHRSALSFLSAEKAFREPEDTRWELQKMVREGSTINTLEQKRDEGLRSHLIMHLAARLEQERHDAEDTLLQSRLQGSPLKEALGEGVDMPDFMDDLSPSLLHPIVEQDLFEDICEAWLGLFGGLLEEGTILVTFKENINAFVSSLFEEAVSQLDLIRKLRGVSFDLGDPLSLGSREISISSEGELQKRVMATMFELERDLHRQGDGAADGSAGLIHSLQEMLPPGNGSGSFHLEMVSLPGIKSAPSPQRSPLLNSFSGKTLVFLKTDSENG